MSDILADPIGEIVSTITPEDIPLAARVTEADLATLKVGDPSPTQVVIRITPGQGGHGWSYTAQAMRQLVDVVNDTTLPGYLGHSHGVLPVDQWHDPLIHWLGAKWDGSAALLRGLIDHGHDKAADIKRWLKSGRIN
jgi:hypothetical protein